MRQTTQTHIVSSCPSNLAPRRSESTACPEAADSSASRRTALLGRCARIPCKWRISMTSETTPDTCRDNLQAIFGSLHTAHIETNIDRLTFQSNRFVFR